MATRSRTALEAALRNPDYEDVSDLPNVTVDLRYGTKRNILSKDVYGGFQRALLHREAAAKFRVASRLLAERVPEWRFLVFDALRPQAAQEEFWELVKGTPNEKFFANPKRGSVHSFGFALDIGLADERGNPLDLGTDFDDMTERAGTEREQELFHAGQLTEHQWALRLRLRSIMTDAGFLQLPHEWWHYDALPGSEVRARYRRCE